MSTPGSPPAPTSPPSPGNLPSTAWKPGQSGNPGGAVKGYVKFAVILQKELARVDRRNKSQLAKIAEKVVAMAVKGDMDAVRWLADRVDGKVTQSISVNSEQTVHVVPWLPAVQHAVDALPGASVPEMEGVEVGEVAPGDADD